MRAFLTLLLVAVAYAELAPLVENVEPIPGKYIIKLKVDNPIIHCFLKMPIFEAFMGFNVWKVFFIKPSNYLCDIFLCFPKC